MAKITLEVIPLEYRETKTGKHMYKGLWKNEQGQNEVVEFFLDRKVDLNRPCKVPFVFGRFYFKK